MKRFPSILLIAGALIFTAFRVSAIALYDGFDYPVGSTLSGLSPQAGSVWNAGASGADMTVLDPGLSYPGLPAGVGASVTLSNTGARVDRIWTSTLGPVASATLYYSMLLKITDITGLTTGTGGVFFAGFNNDLPTSTTGISQAGGRLRMRRDATAGYFNLGIQNDVVSGVGTANIAWATAVLNPADTVYLVVGYDFIPGANNNDVAKLWINPNPLTWDDMAPPAPDAFSTGCDINTLQVQSFFLRQYKGTTSLNMPKALAVDELRVWAVPEPTSSAPLGLGLLALLWKRKHAR